MSFRTDRNNNPTAFTTDVAHFGGLDEGLDYIQGEPFTIGDHTFYTAKIVRDPLDVTIKLMDRAGFYTKQGSRRWTYAIMPAKLWASLSRAQKVQFIGAMYEQEGGTAMKGLFA